MIRVRVVFVPDFSTKGRKARADDDKLNTTEAHYVSLSKKIEHGSNNYTYGDFPRLGTGPDWPATSINLKLMTIKAISGG